MIAAGGRTRAFVNGAIGSLALLRESAELRALFGPETMLVTMINGIPWWYFHALGGPHEGRGLDSVDPGGRIAAAIEPQRIIPDVTAKDLQTNQNRNMAELVRRGLRVSPLLLGGDPHARSDLVAGLHRVGALGLDACLGGLERGNSRLPGFGAGGSAMRQGGAPASRSMPSSSPIFSAEVSASVTSTRPLISRVEV